MTMLVTEHERNLSAAETFRTFSPAVWASCPYDQIRLGLNDGFIFEDDFVDLPTGRYTATQATAGTFALDDAAGGVALADCNSTTATQGINVQLGGTTGELFTPADDRKIWFEARIKAADIATGPEFFLGLSEIDTTIIAASANSSANHIGWESTTDDSILLFFGEKAGTRNSALASPHTFVDDTYVKLGFIVTDAVDTNASKVEHFVDNVKQATTLTSVNIPIVEMVPSLVCQTGGTTDPIVHIDWWRVVQLN